MFGDSCKVQWDTVRFRLVIMGIRVNGMDSWRRIRSFVLFIVIYMELGSDYYPPVGSITGTV